MLMHIKADGATQASSSAEVRFWHLADIAADLSMSALGVKRTSLMPALLSAYDPKRLPLDHVRSREGIGITDSGHGQASVLAATTKPIQLGEWLG